VLTQLLGEIKKLKTSDSESIESTEKFIMHIRTVFYNALLMLLLVGCAGPLTMNKIQYIERGMPLDGFSSMVGRQPARAFTVVDPEDGLEYQVQIFPMQTGIYTTTTHGKYMTYTHTHPVTREYAFLFREDSLLFWGFPHEYARADEQSIRRLAPLIMEGVEKWK
jgi:hypothetical protein